ncbi:MAG: ABC transporter ATP-binding protein [Nitrospirales bacterium]|nr:ABC transporter ATP-binding protein [Nitrospira sp.]MDR4502103.1 ABC transporter ATP-binding protein [Nitrospirales bacterium]
MASLVLDNVTVDFPIYGSQKTFRHALFEKTTGGLIRRDGSTNKRVTVRALENISIKLVHGDRLGIVGHNGAGKSTLLRVCAGVYEPSQGRVIIDGKVSPLFSTSPGLDGDDSGYENIMTCGMYLGMTPEEIVRKTPEIEKFSELGDYLSLPVRTYSTGMLVRLGFGIATSIDPEILLLDEGLGAGDARFADRAKERVDALVERSSILVLASHSDALVKTMCNKAVLLQGGRILASGGVDEVIEEYHAMNQGTG